MRKHKETGKLPSNVAATFDASTIQTSTEKVVSGDYLGLQAFVTPSPVQNESMRLAVTVDHGPHYSRLTEQVYKESREGHFSQVVSPPDDAPFIPKKAGETRVPRVAGEKRMLGAGRRSVLHLHAVQKASVSLETLVTAFLSNTGSDSSSNAVATAAD